MINFEDGNKGTWFYFDENEDIGGICLRVLDTETHNKIEKITTKHKAKFSHGVKYDDVTTDERLASKMRWDYCIVDWKGIQINGEDIECNAANKVRLTTIPDFIKLVGEYLEKLTEDNVALKEARLKNCETSPSGSTDPVE